MVGNIPPNHQRYLAAYLRSPTNSEWVLLNSTELETLKTKNKNILKTDREIRHIMIVKNQHLTSPAHLH